MLSRAKLLMHNGQYEQDVMGSETGSLLHTCRRWCCPPLSAELFSGNGLADVLLPRVPFFIHALPWPAGAITGDRRRLLLDLRRVTTSHGPPSSLSCDSGVCRHGADSPDASKHSSGRFRPPSQFSLSDRSALPGRSTAHQRRPIALPGNPETGCPGSRPERTEGGGPASENCWLAEELKR